jgi:uncharacterized membrane protein
LIRQPEDDAMKRYVAVGLTVLAGAALVEVALVPGVLIGGAALLAPRYLPRLRRGIEPLFAAGARRPAAPHAAQRAATTRRSPARARAASTSTAGASAAAASGNKPNLAALQSVLPKFALGQAVAKTITFRIIVTTLDFSSNYIVIGDFGTAAGLSAFALVVGPLFYLGHEAAWNYLGPSSATTVDLSALLSRRRNGDAPAGGKGLTINRALAKTITFRTIASAMDFTATYVVVGDLATALGLTAFGFVLGPFVYFGHEKVWDYYTSRKAAPSDDQPLALPAPAHFAPARA